MIGWARPEREHASRACALALSLLAGLSASGRSVAADATEFWPEASVFVGLTPRSRLYLDASYAKGKESGNRTLDLSAFVDTTFEPLLRESLRSEDWQRKRYLWTRLGYTRVLKSSSGESLSPAEDRGVVSVYARAELPAEVMLEARARVDLRWIDGQFSSRPRYRLEANREFTVLEHAVLPYFNAEAFYDTRYHGWARALYQGGVEITFDARFRCELYLAGQNDRLPRVESLGAFGVVGKWYY